MGEVIPLRAPVLPRILQAVRMLLDAGCTPKMVCLLNYSDWELFVAEMQEHVRVYHREQCSYPEAQLCVCGAMVTVSRDRFVPNGQLVVQKAPEAAADILKLLYDKSRVDAFMSEPHQLEDAQILKWKGNAP